MSNALPPAQPLPVEPPTRTFKATASGLRHEEGGADCEGHAPYRFGVTGAIVFFRLKTGTEVIKLVLSEKPQSAVIQLKIYTHLRLIVITSQPYDGSCFCTSTQTPAGMAVIYCFCDQCYYSS